MQGIESWENRNGIVVLKVHHTADPEKRSDEWITRESAKYGGQKSAFWRSEYDIDFGARRGGLVFPSFSPDRHCIPPFELPEEWPKYRVIDPGFRNACACAWFTVDFDGNLVLYRELYKQGWKVEALASSIKALSARERYEMTMIDPSAFAKTLAGGGRSVADLFIEAGVPVSPAYRASHKKDQFYPFNELLIPRENGEPAFKVFNNCEAFIAEILAYRWKEARDDGFEPEEPVKVNDHLLDCFEAGTMIELERGAVPVEDVVVGDMALTRLGCRPVLRTRMTGRKPVWSVSLSNGSSLVGTASHPIWTVGSGWKRLDELTQSDMLLTCETSSTSTGSGSTAPSTGSTLGAGTTSLPWKGSCEAPTTSTATSGRQRTAQSLTGCASTTRTETQRTTTCRTSNSWIEATTPGITVNTGLTSGTRSSSSTLQRSVTSLPDGTRRQMEGDGTARMPSTHGSWLSRSSANASSAERRSSAGIKASSSGVHRTAHRSTAEQLELTTRTGSAVAEMSSGSTATAGRGHALGSVRVSSLPRQLGRETEVFNIAVSDVPEYFANGVLVHNCALYMAAAVDPRRVAETHRVRDPLRPWYSGGDRKRRMADERRVRDTALGRSREYEP